jgi:hypothetical protein
MEQRRADLKETLRRYVDFARVEHQTEILRRILLQTAVRKLPSSSRFPDQKNDVYAYENGYDKRDHLSKTSDEVLDSAAR